MTPGAGAAVGVPELAGADAAEALARLRAAEPVAWVDALGSWLVTSYDLAVAVMRDAETFTVDDPRFSTGQVVGPSMLSTDGAVHQRHRAPFQKPFRPAQVEARFGRDVEALAAELVELIRPAGRADVRAAVAGPLSVAVMAEALGLQGVDSTTVLGWYAAIVAAVSSITAGGHADPTSAAAVDELAATVRSRLDDGADASVLTAARGALADSEIVSNAAVMMFGGIETTEAMISNAVVHLLGDPAALDAVRADHSLIASAVEESLRLEPAAAVVDRYATRDVELGAAAIGRGDPVRVSIAGANRDPATFPDPDRFDPRRPNVRSQLSFARGPHVCIAMDLARLETRIAIGTLLDRLPGLRLDGPAPAHGLVFRKPDFGAGQLGRDVLSGAARRPDWPDVSVGKTPTVLTLIIPLVLVLAAAAAVVVTVVSSTWWLFLTVPLVAVAALATYDVLQRRHSVLRNYPVVGHLRYLLEKIRPELQQYFIERNFDGRPYDRDVRSVIYERAKGIHGEQAFGTEREVNEVGYEWVLHSSAPNEPAKDQPRVRVGGPDCTQPYDMALLNVSAMSFGALSANAIRALNIGAARGGFAHDTGEGGLTDYHLEGGGDLIWEIGSGYFGARTKHGDFDAEMFRDKAAHEQVRCVSLKLSQGAKPGIGGVLPAAKVSAEIAAARNVPQGEKCVSPAAHRVFHTPRELVQFIGRMRELAGGKPTGFKLCVGYRHELLAICKAMLEEQITPDFIVVDGSEGGTGAAPLEYEDNVGSPLTDGLIMMHNALVGTGLRSRIKLGASGKVATGTDIVKRLAQGADYTNAARAMMMAVGCIQAQKCHTNECPVGVATQDPRRARALDVADKSVRVQRYQQATVAQAQQMVASLGLGGPEELHPAMLMRRIDHVHTASYADLYDWLEPDELVHGAPQDWARDWDAASPDDFARC